MNREHVTEGLLTLLADGVKPLNVDAKTCLSLEPFAVSWPRHAPSNKTLCEKTTKMSLRLEFLFFFLFFFC